MAKTINHKGKHSHGTFREKRKPNSPVVKKLQKQK